MRTHSIPNNWVFLGDSLTEGIGSRRVSHVSELVKSLRVARDRQYRAVHYMRLQEVDSHASDRSVNFNVAGLLDTDPPGEPSLWIWNLGCEGRTIESDLAWTPFVKSLQPERVVIFRGSLECIIRPAMIKDGGWPLWLPKSWRNYSSLDPRCYFSSTWWRQAKQHAIDRAKQLVRHRLLAERPGQPLIELDIFIKRYEELLSQLRGSVKQILMVGLLPVDDRMFPGSAEYFRLVTDRLNILATRYEANFIDWGSTISSIDGSPELFYRDGFHPNSRGAKILAEILRSRLEETRVLRTAANSVR